MNPWTTLASLLQSLPPGIRRTLYSVVTAAGAVLAVGQIAGWQNIGPVDLDEALAAYALLSSPTGFLALANVKPRADGSAGRDGFAGGYDDLDDTYDRYDVRYDEDYDDQSYDGYDDRADDLVPSGAPSRAWRNADEESFS